MYELFPVLELLDRRIGGYLSGGEQQMLTIGRTLMGNPSLLLLDEPVEGVAPVVVQELTRQIKRLKGMGLTILFAEQNMHFATESVRPCLRNREGTHPLPRHHAGAGGQRRSQDEVSDDLDAPPGVDARWNEIPACQTKDSPTDTYENA